MWAVIAKQQQLKKEAGMMRCQDIVRFGLSLALILVFFLERTWDITEGAAGWYRKREVRA